MSGQVKDHKALVKLLRLAHSAERAASYAYQGHAAITKSPEIKESIKQIEDDEWRHRAELLEIMNEHGVTVSKFYEIKYYIIGKIIGLSCFFIGFFLANYFAGRLESGNVIEYFNMRDMFNELGITKYDACMEEMAQKEKDHELFFLELVKDHWLLPLFSTIFRWGPKQSFNGL